MGEKNKVKKVLFAATVDSHIIHFHIPYLKLFKEKGYEVHVATNGDESIPYCDVKHVIPFERSPLKLNNLRAIVKLKKIIEKEKFEIIHCHTPMGSVVTRLASMKARKNGTRVIYTAHGFHFFKGASKVNWLIFYPIEKLLSRYTDVLITINQEDYDLAKEKFHAKQTELVYGVGVDSNKFNFEMPEEEKEKLRKQVGVGSKDFVMICIGELNDNKNQIMQIEAVRELVKNNKNIKLLLAGDGDKKEFLQEKIKEYGLQDNVKLLGYRKDIPRLLKIANLALSTSKREGLPVNVIEALTVGIPVIGTNCRGTRDLIKENLNGYIVEDNVVEGLIAKIRKVQNTELKFNENLGEEYNLDNILSKFEEIYFKPKKSVMFLRSTSAINDSRLIKEVTSILKCGYKVKILCWDRDGFAKDNNVLQTECGNAELVKFSKEAKYGSGIKNILNIMAFQKWLKSKLKKENSSYEIIHSCDLDTGMPALNIAKKYNKKLVYDIFDYYVHSHNMPKILEGVLEKQEIKIINAADITIICGEWRKEQIDKATPKKLIVIHNSPNINYEEIDNRDSIIKSKNNKIKVVYVGVLQDDRLLTEIAESIKEEMNIELHIGGFGKYSGYFKTLSEQNDNIYFYGTMKYNEVLKLESECDVLFATYNPSIKNHRYSAPNKVYEAMALGKPIVVCKNTGIDNFVLKNKLGIAVKYNAVDFLNSLQSVINSYQNVSQELFKSKYSWNQMEKIISTIYK